ncbi:MAG: hypothetical protein ACTSQK_00600 [Candidatus Heimdallarchaeota archaeon]
MNSSCFNCQKSLVEGKPICPYCFAVQRNSYDRDQLFDYLEHYFPTKPAAKKQYVSTKVQIIQRDYENILVWSILTLGVYYFYYLLLTLQDLNDHWYHPHGRYEATTKNDTFTLMVILTLTLFLGVPFIQYVRYEKLRNHLLKAPPMENQTIPIKGSQIFWIYIIYDLFFLGTGAMLFFGLSSVIADWFFKLDTAGITTVFFLGAATVFTLALLSGIALIILEMRWQEIFNDHIAMHYNGTSIKKRRRRILGSRKIKKDKQKTSI